MVINYRDKSIRQGVDSRIEPLANNVHQSKVRPWIGARVWLIDAEIKGRIVGINSTNHYYQVLTDRGVRLEVDPCRIKSPFAAW